MFLVAPALAGVFFTPEPPGNPFSLCSYLNKSLSRCLKLNILSSSHYQHLSFQISWKNNPHWLYLFVVSTSQSTVVWLRLITTSYMLNQMDALQDVSPMTFLQHLALLLLRSSSMSSVCAFPLASETAAFADSSCSACFFFFFFFNIWTLRKVFSWLSTQPENYLSTGVCIAMTSVDINYVDELQLQISSQIFLLSSTLVFPTIHSLKLISCGHLTFIIA